MVPIVLQIVRLRVVARRRPAAARKSSRSPASARFTASIDTGRLTASGFSSAETRRFPAGAAPEATRGCRWSVGQPWEPALFDSMSEGTVKRAKLKYPFEMALNERDFFTEKTETRATPLTCPRCHRKNDYQMQVGAADQEEQDSTGSRRTRPRAVRETARLHDPGGRRRALPDVPDPVRGAVPSVARVPAGRRARRERGRTDSGRDTCGTGL